MRKITGLFVGLLLLSGCTTTVTPKIDKKIENAREFKASFDRTWDATVAAVSSSGDVINSLEKDSGVISFSHEKFTSDGNEASRLLLISEGKICWAVKFSANALVKRINDKSTSITIHTQATATCGNRRVSHFFSQKNSSMELASSGVLEKELFDAIEKNLK